MADVNNVRGVAVGHFALTIDAEWGTRFSLTLLAMVCWAGVKKMCARIRLECLMICSIASIAASIVDGKENLF